MDVSMAHRTRDESKTYLVVSHCNNLAIRLLAKSIENQRGVSCTAISSEDLFCDQIQDDLVLINVLPPRKSKGCLVVSRSTCRCVG